MKPSTFNPSRAWALNKPSELQPHHEMDSLSSRKRKINAPLKAFEQTWHLASIEADVETANVLVFMNRATTDSDNGRNKKEASHSPCQEEYKRPEDIPRVLTEQAQLVNDRPSKACPRCPVCSKGLQLLPSDTNFMEPFRNATFSKYANDHSNKFHRHEPLWNALSNLDLECVDTDLILRMQSDAEASDALIAQCLAIAARSLRIPKKETWGDCWSRVRALILARIGSAHCSATNAKLYACQGANGETREVELKRANRAKRIKEEATLYLAALMSSVEVTLPHPLWKADSSDHRRRNCVQTFFFANHRYLSLIDHSLLPIRPHSRNLTICRALKDNAALWQTDETFFDWGGFDIDSTLIMKIESEKDVRTVVAQCLAIAARSMRTPNNKAWAECWSRVKALALARIGSAHCFVSSAKLYVCQGVKTETREVEHKNAKLIKGEAKSYLAALLGSLEATPPPSLWQADLMELRIDLLSLFFMDGANHRQHGFIHPDFLPSSLHF